ncbi:MAG: hypothetical protein AAGM40_22315 [Cyanobacteria bacterium J06573_2]
MTNTNKPKICITTIEFPPDVGGVGESVHRIAKMLTGKGYEVHVAVFRSSQRSVPDDTYRRAGYKTTVQEDIFVHRIKSSIRSEITELSGYLSDIYFQLKLLHQKYQFNLFHAFSLAKSVVT